MHPVPINMAEAVFEPFWDPRLSGLQEWTIEPGILHGLQVYQQWCWVAFEWARKPQTDSTRKMAIPALRMSRTFDIPCEGYDRLLVSIMAPEGSIFRLTATTDVGTLTFEAPPAPALKKEHVIDLHGARRIHTITLELEATAEGVAQGWINWLGLQNTTLLAKYQDLWDRFDERWEPYIRPADYEPRFEPTYGILVTRDELARLRAEHESFLQKHGQSPFTVAAELARQHIPEKMIRESVNFWGDTRYCRERDHGNVLLPNPPHGSTAAIAGLLLKDKSLLRLAARYAMALAMCDHWDDGMICYFPGSTFEHRCFVQSLCVHEIALLLDLAGEMFTNLGRDLLLRRMAEEGQGSINYNVWRHEYIFHCNQLAWFSPGRLLGYAVMEQTMPRVEPYTDMAYRDLVESLGYAILPDGGYVEGPSYFTCVGRSGGLSLYYYARTRGMDWQNVVPEIIKRTADFGEAIASTDEQTDVIPICDGSPLSDQETLAVMAALLPDSQWVNMFHKSVARTGGMPRALLAWQLAAQIPTTGPDPRPFVFLPNMGIMSSVRNLDGETVKLFLMGNHAGAGHTHEDKGSFVLEFAGETFAMDPGTCDYSSPLASIVQNCERHNMLVPIGMSERPHPACPLPVDVKPQGHGDAHAFHAILEATPGWEGYYRRWVRTWDSPSPQMLTIHDEYELLKGNAVEFYWNTRLPVRVEGNRAILQGNRGTATLYAPQECSIRVDELPLFAGDFQRRIAIRQEGRGGSLTIRVQLALLPNN